MFQALPVCAALLALPSAGAAENPNATETVIRLTVQPMAAPKPALKYQLLPELREMNPGNPILGYLRCFSEQNYFFFNKQAFEEREKWAEMPLKDLPAKDLQNYGGIALRQADYAARLTTPDWQVLPKLKEEGVFLLVPDVQQMRTLARALQVRFRAQVAARRFDAAEGTAKTMLALARVHGRHPTLIASLVGFAIAMETIGPLEEMIQQPGCPNLYWALTLLPRPFLDLRQALQGERMILDREMALLDENAPMTEAQLNKAITRFHTLAMALAGNRPARVKEVADRFIARTKDDTYLRAARKRLAEAGLDPAQVKKFPPLQVVLLDEKHAYLVRRDNDLRLLALPYWQAQALVARNPRKEKEEQFLSALLFPPLGKVGMAQARLDQRFAMLRCVEALRLYAAAHDGRLPAKLADVEVPVPVDPISGRPFFYKADGATATLRGSAPAGFEKSPYFNIRYEITMKK